jgi:hypothetical protein
MATSMLIQITLNVKLACPNAIIAQITVLAFPVLVILHGIIVVSPLNAVVLLDRSAI